MAAYQLFFFAGVRRTGVAVGTIVGIGSAPILAGAIGFLARGERPGRRWAVATLLAVMGCSLLIAAGRSLHVDPTGLLLAIGAGAAYASFTVASKGLLEHNPPEAVMAVIFCIGALFLAPLFFTADFTWLAQPRGLAVTLHLGLVSVALAYNLFARGLTRVPVATAATLTLAEPLTAGMLGVFLLGERLTPLAGFGILLIFMGLALVSVRQSPAPLPSSLPKAKQ
jgi:DME family drug/metabolite transporter